VQKVLFHLNKDAAARARFKSDRDALTRYSEEEIERDAGPGGHEARAWIVVSAATEGARGETLCFEPIPGYAITGAIATCRGPVTSDR
jgi:hypothetical protein